MQATTPRCKQKNSIPTMLKCYKRATCRPITNRQVVILNFLTTHITSIKVYFFSTKSLFLNLKIIGAFGDLSLHQSKF